MGSMASGFSALEYVRTTFPAASLISSVTGLEDARLQIVIDHSAIRRIFAGREVRRQRRIRIHVPANARGGLRLEQECI